MYGFFFNLSLETSTEKETNVISIINEVMNVIKEHKVKKSVN